MGTYTTNYQLYTPTVGETGWGTLVNGNFTTIDSTMKSLSNRITAVESEVNGALSCTSVTASGKITGNGGIAGTTGTFSGAVTGTSFNGVTIAADRYNGVPIGQSLIISTAGYTPGAFYVQTGTNNTVFAIAESTFQTTLTANTNIIVHSLCGCTLGTNRTPTMAVNTFTNTNLCQYELYIDSSSSSISGSTITLNDTYKSIVESNWVAIVIPYNVALDIVHTNFRIKSSQTCTVRSIRLQCRNISDNNLYVSIVL